MLTSIVGALVIGVTLGVFGSGGSILTVPALVHLAGQSEKVAIAGSLLVVGSISVVAALPYAIAGEVDRRSVVWFGLPGIVGTWSGAALSRWVDGRVQMVLFALVAIGAAVLLMRKREGEPRGGAPHARWKIVLEGLAVGVLTGLVGVGGGFLIVPALVLLGGLPLRRAVGTSLVVIALKSFAGFAKSTIVLQELGLALDLRVLALFAGFGIAGSLGASAIAGRLPQAALQRTFAIVLIAVGTWTLADTLTRHA